MTLLDSIFTWVKSNIAVTISLVLSAVALIISLLNHLFIRKVKRANFKIAKALGLYFFHAPGCFSSGREKLGTSVIVLGIQIRNISLETDNTVVGYEIEYKKKRARKPPQIYEKTYDVWIPERKEWLYIRYDDCLLALIPFEIPAGVTKQIYIAGFFAENLPPSKLTFKVIIHDSFDKHHSTKFEVPFDSTGRHKEES